MKRGESTIFVSLSPADIIEVCARRSSGQRIDSIAQDLGLTLREVRQVLNKKVRHAMAYIEYEKTRTRYHSRDWEHLVEQGWITQTVEENPSDGCQVAVMIRQKVASTGGSNSEK